MTVRGGAVWWGRRRSAERAAAEQAAAERARAESALREVTAAFYEIEVISRRYDRMRALLGELVEARFGLSRHLVAAPVQAARSFDRNVDDSFVTYFEMLDRWTPLSRFAEAADLRQASQLFEEWRDVFADLIERTRAVDEDWETMLETFGRFRTHTLGILRAAESALDAGAADLTALTLGGIDSPSLKRDHRETTAALNLLAEGRTDLTSRTEVSSRGHQLLADASEMRRRARHAPRHMATTAVPIG
ncbi:hypothetical protein ACFQ9U_00345 [Streptomyces sp. NPDC056568]|uniref:hypothetical protein n=1 Tax=Streptomyces sp. NPDC056568 TaxID=3345866 RepID=UPI0036C2791C